MKVLAIVVTYNGEFWISKCLQSLTTSSHPVDVVVIDNLSADNTVDIIKKEFPAIEIIEAGENLGFGKANNIGFKKALKENADFIFLLNQDAWIHRNTIAELLSIATTIEGFGILSPFHLKADHSTLERTFVDFISAAYNEKIIEDLYLQELKPVYETSYVHAAAWLISKECLETVGGFDPIFKHYGEDDDYLQRARYFGFKIGLVPSATIVHDAVYKSWDLVEWDENRNMVVELQHLKRMFPHFRTNVLSYFKRGFDELTTLLLFRKFKKLRFRFKMMSKALLNIKAIHSSYKNSFTKGAYLS